jgi:RNA polymerase sigma-70 factor, ECF subfamily
MRNAALMTDIPGEANISFDTAVRRREAQVLRIAYRMLGNWADAEDVAQESFIRLHRHGLTDFPDDVALGAWLCRVTANLCLDRLRTRARWRTSECEEMTAPGSSAESEALRDEQKRLLMDALKKLPERERAAVVLREIEGLSTAETAAAMGSTEVTVRSQISKALGRLRALVTKEQR